MIGIYTIKNTKNNNLYIGSSKNIEVRFIHHKSLLRSNKHHSIHLQNAWNLYGEECFIFNIIEECTLDILLEREQFYLDKLLKANDYVLGKSDYFLKYGYNICPFSIKGFTGKHDRRSILKQLKSRRLSEIYQIDYNGNILNIYDMISECPDNRGSIYLSIKKGQCLQNKMYGYIKSDDYIEGFRPKQIEIWNKNKKSPTNKGTTIYVYDIYGRYYNTFPTIKLCADHFQIQSSSICTKLNKKDLKLIGNSIITKYCFFTTPQQYTNILDLSNSDGNIVVYTIFNEFIGYSSIKELNNLLDLEKSSIYGELNNKRKQLKGYIFKYRDDIV